MSSRQPVLGSKAVYTPALSNEMAHVTASTCFQLALFKDLMKDLRKADDSITMRMNRNLALFRDRAREAGGQPAAEEACAYFWRELMATWKGRADIIEYCVSVVDAAADDTRRSTEGQAIELDEELERRTRGELYGNEVKRNMIHNELTVEAIIRKRSLDVFKSRCRFFEPPLNDVEGRKWWDAAHAGR